MKKLISFFLVIGIIFIGSSCGSKSNKPIQLTDTTIVYWVPKGKVYHIDKNCTTLRRSSDIESGTVEEAKNSGKSRLCEVCGNGDIDVKD